MKRSPLRPVSKKTAAKRRREKPGRDAFREHFHMCMCCCRRLATDVHEIVKRSHSETSTAERATWLCLCRSCHDGMDDHRHWPISRQLALKLVSDPEFFDLPTIHRLRGTADTEFRLTDIVRHLEVKR